MVCLSYITNYKITEFLPVNKILRLLACANQLNNGVKHLCTIGLFLLFKNEHEVVTKACLHHDPVNCASQVYVSRQENNIFTCTKFTSISIA